MTTKYVRFTKADGTTQVVPATHVEAVYDDDGFGAIDRKIDNHVANKAINIENTGTVTLATAIEANHIDITQPKYSQGDPVKLLNFHWYGDKFSIGAIRTNDEHAFGLGIYFNNERAAYWDNHGYLHQRGNLYTDRLTFDVYERVNLFATSDSSTDPVNDQKASFRISSSYSTGFYDSCTGKGYTVGIDHRTGNVRTKGSIDADKDVYARSGWFRTCGETGWYNEKYAGGWYMTDNDWVRVYNNKGIYTSGTVKADSGFKGNLIGQADSAIADKNGKDIATSYLPLAGGTMTGPLTASADINGTRISASDWFRSKEGTGWYSEKYGGGWHMTDPDWIRAYNGKGIYTSGSVKADGGFKGIADYAESLRTIDAAGKKYNAVFHWQNKEGQPTWLWGGDNGVDMYVYNPLNFNVKSVGGYTAAQLIAAAANDLSTHEADVNAHVDLFKAVKATTVTSSGPGYRVYADGRKEQWGTIPCGSNDVQNYFVFPVAYNSPPTNVSLTAANQQGTIGSTISVVSVTTTSLRTIICCIGSGATTEGYWRTDGY